MRPMRAKLVKVERTLQCSNLFSRAAPDVAHRNLGIAENKKPTFALRASVGEVGSAGQISNLFIQDLKAIGELINYNRSYLNGISIQNPRHNGSY